MMGTTARSKRQKLKTAFLLYVAGSCQGGYADTLLDIYRLAEQKDAKYLAVMAKRDAVLEAQPQTRAQAYLPTVGLIADVFYNSQDISGLRFGNQAAGPGDINLGFRSYDYVLSLTQPIFRYDRWVAYDQATKRAQQASLDVAAEQQDLALRVAQRYFDVLAAVDGLAYAQAQKNALERQLEQASQRYRIGVTAITDVQETQAGYDRAVSEEIQAQNQIDIAAEFVREITGEYYSSIAPLSGELPLVKPDPANIEDWTARALEQNLRLASAQALVDITREEIKRQRAGHLPTLDIVGSYGVKSGGGTIGSVTESADIGIQLNVPLFQGGYVSAKTREAEYLYQEALEKLESERRSAHRDVRTAYLNVMSSISRIEALKQSLVSSETAIKATEAGFLVGTRTAVDVVTTERQLFLARRDCARAKYDYLLDSFRLKRAVGALALNELATVDRLLGKSAATSAASKAADDNPLANPDGSGSEARP